MSNSIVIESHAQVDRGLTYAEACFETFRVIDGNIFAWQQHWQRICIGLQTFGITCTPSWEKSIFTSALNQAGAISSDCLVRLTISGGDSTWGLQKKATPKCLIQVHAYEKNIKPYHIKSVEYPFALRPKPAKFTADYAETLRAIQIWRQQHLEISPQQSFICKDKKVISGLTSNVILYYDGKWLTPDGDGVLNGVLRQYFIDKGLIKKQICPIQLLDYCEAAMLLNCGTFLRPIHSLNRREISATHPAIERLHHVLKAEKGVLLEHI